MKLPLLTALWEKKMAVTWKEWDRLPFCLLIPVLLSHLLLLWEEAPQCSFAPENLLGTSASRPRQWCFCPAVCDLVKRHIAFYLQLRNSERLQEFFGRLEVNCSRKKGKAKGETLRGCSCRKLLAEAGCEPEHFQGRSAPWPLHLTEHRRATSGEDDSSLFNFLKRSSLKLSPLMSQAIFS